MKELFIVILITILASCSTIDSLKNKLSSDSNDSKPIDPNSACSQDQRANIIEPKEAKLNTFSNNLYEINVTVSKVGFFAGGGFGGSENSDTSHIIQIKNKTKEPMKIIWDQSNYISKTGESDGLLVEGTKFISLDQPTPPTMIVPGSFIKKLINAKSNVYFYSGWKVADYDYESKQTFAFNLAIEVNGKIQYVPIKLEVCED